MKKTNGHRSFAAVDLGSNSFHLIRADIVDQQIHIRHRSKQRVRLAAGLDSDRRLSDEAIKRGVDALALFQEHLDGLAPDSIRMVATHTLRQARNAREFLAAARQVTQVPIEVISGPEEGRLTYRGVAFSEQLEGATLLIDIGGGSTEFVLGQASVVQDVASRSMGCVVFQKRFFDAGISQKAFKQAINEARVLLEPIRRRFLGFETALGSSGSVKAISRCCEAFLGDPEITDQAMAAVQDKLCELDEPTFVEQTGMQADRYQVLAGGIAILRGAFACLKIPTLRAAQGALREGLLVGFLDSGDMDSVRRQTLKTLQKRYGVDVAQAKRVATIAKQFAKDFGVDDPATLQLLQNACGLHELGQAVSYSDHHQHGQYLLTHSDLPGYHQQDQAQLALWVGAQRKRLPELADFSEQTLRALAAMRLAIAVCVTRQDQDWPVIENGVLSLPSELDWMRAGLAKELKRLRALGVALTLSELD